MNKHALRGFSLVEMMFVVAIVGIIMAAVYTSMTAATRATRTGFAVAQIQDEGRRVLDQFASDLRGSLLVEVAISSPDGLNWDIMIPNIIDADDTGLVFGQPILYVVSIASGEAINGQDKNGDGDYDQDDDTNDNGATDEGDDDQDGLVDEYMIVRRHPEDASDPLTIYLETRLTDHVRSTPLVSGFTMSVAGNVATLTLNLITTDDQGRVLDQTVSTTVLVRN